MIFIIVRLLKIIFLVKNFWLSGNSRPARSLGIVTTGPTAICSRSYVEAGTFRFKEDGVCFYRPSLIPGYFSMFKQADGDLGLYCYIIPGSRSKIGDLKRMHHSFIKEDPFISAVLGEAFLKNDLSKQYLKRYHKRCMKSFGRGFKWPSRKESIMNIFKIYVFKKVEYRGDLTFHASNLLKQNMSVYTYQSKNHKYHYFFYQAQLHVSLSPYYLMLLLSSYIHQLLL